MQKTSMRSLLLPLIVNKTTATM